VNGKEAGYTRKRCGNGFSYRDPSGKRVRSAQLRERFERLAIPPAWEDVWICRDPDGHLQATGRDAAGRKQYIYHPVFRKARDRKKYRRMSAFGRALPRLRRRVSRDLRREGLGRERVLAAIVKLLETTLARVGNEEYARQNESFGVTSLRKKHVKRGGEGLSLAFAGKGGREWLVEVKDAAVIAVIEQCLQTPGRELFKYFDGDDQRCAVAASDVNAYLRDIAGDDVSAKDFRTWAGTVLASAAFAEIERSDPDAQSGKKVAAAVKSVAEVLGNTPAICRQAYMHPDVVEGFAEGELVADAAPRARRRKSLNGLKVDEAALLVFLEDRTT
jgi:DNA topoisomerase-1